MLRIIVPGGEFYDDFKEEFIYEKDQELQMEHSLISISKWEAKWHEAYNKEGEKTPEQILDYFKCMTINRVDPEVYNRLTEKNIQDIIGYINEPMTACYFRNDGITKSRDTLTSELIYYYMIVLGIPFECEKWHFNKLTALIEVCSMKNKPAKTMSPGEIARRNAKLNAARRKAHHTKG